MLEAGSVVGGKYRLVAHIGEGGMGVVWRATHEHLGNDVAVKFLTHVAANSPQLVARFLDEARTAVSVRHRNVVQILDFGVAEDDRPFMVMEYLEGESLADRIGRKPPLSLGETTQTIGLTLSGLGAVHDRGIVHRDLKPENIFLTHDADGFFPKILDFGVSKDLERELEGGRGVRTRDGVLLGTPQYMSPEQARGLRDIDQRSDIYSMGVILYELLTGVSPFDSENVGDVLMKVMSSDYPRIGRIRSDVPQPVIDVVERAMSLDREARFADAREMRHALFAAVASSSPETFGLGGSSVSLNPELTSAVVAALSQNTSSAELSALARLPLAPTTQLEPAHPVRTPATSIDKTTPFRTDPDLADGADAGGTGAGAASQPKKSHAGPAIAIGLSFSVLISLAAVELRAPGTLEQTAHSLFAPTNSEAPFDGGASIVDAGVDAGTIVVRLRPVPEGAVVTIGGRVYTAAEVAELRNANGLLTIAMPRIEEEVTVRVEVPGFEPFEDQRSLRNNASFRVRLHSLDAGVDAGIDAGVEEDEPAPRRRRRARSR